MTARKKVRTSGVIRACKPAIDFRNLEIPPFFLFHSACLFLLAIAMSVRHSIGKLSASLSFPARRYASTATAASNLPEGLKSAIEVYPHTEDILKYFY